MSDAREVEVVVGKPTASDINSLPLAQRKARLATILDRNNSNDKFRVELPDDLYGEWKPADPVSIAEAERVGFKIDETYAPKTTPFRSNRYIDVVYMTIPKETKQLIDEVQAEEVNRHHNPKKQTGKIDQQVEDIHTDAERSTVGLPIISESSSASVTGSQIESTLKTKG